MKVVNASSIISQKLLMQAVRIIDLKGRLVKIIQNNYDMRKYCYELSEHRPYKCRECGRTMHEPTPHICNGQYRKHKLNFLKKDYGKD